MPTWFIQHIGSRAMHDGWDIVDGCELMFVDHFANDNDLADALHEGGIVGVAKYYYEKDDDNENCNSNTYEGLYNPPGIALDPPAARGEISWVPPP